MPNAKQHNKKSMTELPLHLHKNVLIQQKEENWEPVTISQIGPETRCYLCRTIIGKLFHRNRKHIQNTGMPDTL